MKETDKIYTADKGEEELRPNVRHILQEARAKLIHHVNPTLARAYWQAGKYIVEYEQQGTGRAGYGKAVINTPVSYTHLYHTVGQRLVFGMPALFASGQVALPAAVVVAGVAAVEVESVFKIESERCV